MVTLNPVSGADRWCCENLTKELSSCLAMVLVECWELIAAADSFESRSY